MKSPEDLAAQLPAFSLDSQIQTCTKYKIKAVFYTGDGYPDSLLQTPDPPAILFYRGVVKPNKLPFSVAVIGSRRCSIYGRTMARKLSMQLCRAGACVISGLARGIDGEAHRGALDGAGPTVAVMGGGLDIIYPPEHESLANSIVKKGCLISEYPPGVKPARYTFPERNRIISGLSKAIVVVEAGERSGTMITVGTALDQGREVYAVPGDINRSSSKGSNRLLRDGAGIVLSPQELISELKLEHELEFRHEFDLETAEIRINSKDSILAVLQKKQLTVSQISQLISETTGLIQERLLNLELNGLVIRRPGGTFVAV